MVKRVILSEAELKRVLHDSVERALIKEHVDMQREIVLAQKTVVKMSTLLSDLGLRLDGTRYRHLYENVRDSLVALNSALIKHIKGGGK